MEHPRGKSALRRLALATTYLAALGALPNAFGHGLMEDPPSRNWFCGAITKPHEIGGGNAQYPVCGDAFKVDPSGSYNFMSVLTHARGRAVVRPLPENVCSFNTETWKGKATPWDQPIDWPTSKIAAGRKKISWNIAWGPHFSDTEEFRYWITKPDFQFQANKAMAWSDFEDAAFCELRYDDTNPGGNPDVVSDKPGQKFHTYCNIPPRQGRHVIYGEWGRNSWTDERFHGCLDVVFESSGLPVEARIALRPDQPEYVGAGAVALDGSGSVGTGLSYRWTLNAANPSLYRLEDANQAVARLTMDNPGAEQTVEVSLLASNGAGSSTATKRITHKPAANSNWQDLGLLTREARNLAAGDRVSLRVVLASGQDRYVPATPVTLTAANSGAAAWPLVLAEAVNAEDAGVRVGVLNANNQVVPIGDAIANHMYAAKTAGISSAYLQVQSTPPGPVTATYTINDDWGAGYCARLKITNTGNATVRWATSFKVAGTVNNLWNGKWSQAGDTVSISGPDWAAELAAAASFEQAGFCAKR